MFTDLYHTLDFLGYDAAEVDVVQASFDIEAGMSPEDAIRGNLRHTVTYIDGVASTYSDHRLAVEYVEVFNTLGIDDAMSFARDHGITVEGYGFDDQCAAHDALIF